MGNVYKRLAYNVGVTDVGRDDVVGFRRNLYGDGEVEKVVYQVQGLGVCAVGRGDYDALHVKRLARLVQIGHIVVESESPDNVSAAFIS